MTIGPLVEIMFCFVVAICDLVHDVSYLLTASGNLSEI